MTGPEMTDDSRNACLMMGYADHDIGIAMLYLLFLDVKYMQINK